MRRWIVGLFAGLLIVLTGAVGVADPTIPPLPPPLGPGQQPPSEPEPQRSPPPPPPTAAPTDRWALIVGITEYGGRVQHTIGSANDARLLRDVLLRNGWRSDRIRILTDRQATGRAIAEGMSWLQANSSPQTFSLFHYSGHVKVRDGHQHLWPYDSAFIVDTEAVRVLRAVRGTAWSNFSGCHAGGFDDGLSSPRHLVTASSQVNEKSYEDPGTRFSVWSGMLFAEAIDQNRGDRNHDGVTDVGEGFDAAAPRAREFTSGQRPYGAQTPYRAGGSGQLRLDSPRI